MLIDHKDIPQVSQAFMNETHKEEVDIINALFEEILAFEKGTQNSEVIDAKYQEWIAHTIDHFSTEEEEMIEAAFPPYPVHKGEHDRVLTQMKEVFDAWESQREIKILKSYLIEIVPEWLVTHISTMDAMTANYIGGGMAHAFGGMH